MSGMAGVERCRRIKAKCEAINRKEDERRMQVDACIAMLERGQRVRVLRAIAQSILLSSPYVLSGKLLHISGKSVGAGVWELWCEQGSEVQA